MKRLLLAVLGLCACTESPTPPPEREPLSVWPTHGEGEENLAVAILKEPVGEFTYDFHMCKRVGGALVCTACYRHPRKLLGTQSVVCTSDACTLLRYPDEIQEHGVDMAYCEKEMRKR